MTDGRGPSPQRRVALAYWVTVLAGLIGLIVLGRDHLFLLTLSGATAVGLVIGLVQAVRAYRAHPALPDLDRGDRDRMREVAARPDRVVALPARLRASYLARVRRRVDIADAGGPWLLPAVSSGIAAQLLGSAIADAGRSSLVTLIVALLSGVGILLAGAAWRRDRALLDHPEVVEAESRDRAGAEPTGESGSRRD